MKTRGVNFDFLPRAVRAPAQYWISLPIWFWALEDTGTRQGLTSHSTKT